MDRIIELLLKKLGLLLIELLKHELVLQTVHEAVVFLVPSDVIANLGRYRAA